MKKGLPIGINEFSEMKSSNAYYVDKTMLIKEWLDNISKVTLITRPRRFGKTLNMTMLREFFDITKDNGVLFENLAIMETPWVSEMNQWPVIYISMKDCKGDRERMMKCIYQNLSKLYLTFYSTYTSLNPYTEKRLSMIMESLSSENISEDSIVDNALYFLSELLNQHYGKKVIMLIDEYDTPMINAYEQGYYDDVRFFFKNLYGSALKDNPYLERAMVTGIHQIAKESIFSDLNNLEVCTIRDRLYNQYFGLTPKEAGRLLTYYGLDLNDIVKAMYDGYLFGGQEMYNPWSIINYAKRHELDSFWVNTATNTLLSRAILGGNADIRRDFEKLVAGETVRVPVNLQVSFFEMQQPSTLWGLFLNCGYLTMTEPYQAGELQTPVRIPNDEVVTSFREIVSRYGGFKDNELDALFDALIVKDIPAFKQRYTSIVLENVSFYDFKENGFHLLFLGMCAYLRQKYRIFSNIEFGYGRPDIRLEAKQPGLHHIIIEFKYGEELERLAQEALEQIHEKQYYAGLQGEVLLLGIAHNKKVCAIADEILIN